MRVKSILWVVGREGAAVWPLVSELLEGMAQAEGALSELKSSGELEAAQLDAAAAKAQVANMTARLKEVGTSLWHSERSCRIRGL